MPTYTEAEFDQLIVKFQFLYDIPTLDITPSLEQDECFICKDSYQSNKWELGGTVNHPVALPCGHTLGLQCLARWVLLAGFDNSCCSCRTPIINPPATRGQLSRALAPSFGLEILAVVGSNGISDIQKMRLLRAFEKSLGSEETLWKLRKKSDRVMVVWEEMLNKLCNDSAAFNNQDHEPFVQGALGPAARVQLLMPRRGLGFLGRL